MINERANPAPAGVMMIQSVFYPSVGGAQTHTLRLSRALIERGVDVAVITRHYRGLRRYERIEGVPVFRVGNGNWPKALAAISFILDALWLLASQHRRYPILHCHQMISPMTIGLLARLLFGGMLVVNPHRSGPIGDVGVLTIKRPFTGRLRLAAARRLSDAFVCISRDIRNELLAAGVAPQRLWDIPNGVDTGHFRPVDAAERRAARAALGLPDGRAIVFAGRLVAEKCIDDLLHALAIVVEELPDAYAVIVGEGEQQAQLRSLAAELGLKKRVVFTGPRDDVAPYLRAADMFVLPSRAEGLPVSLLEAMATGLPCVATAVGGTTQLIRDGELGRLVPVGDSARLAGALVEALVDPLALHWAAAAREHVVAQYGLATTTQRYQAMYGALTPRPPLPAAGEGEPGLPSPAAGRGAGGEGNGKTIAYVMSRFPTISETFILYEILELERLGLRVEIFPLIQEHEDVQHPEAPALVARAHFSTPLAPKVVAANLLWLRRRPVAYARAWRKAIAGNWRSPKFLSRALVVVPQAAWFAQQMVRLGSAHVHAHWATHPTLAAYVVHELADLPYSFTAHAHDIYVERPMLDQKIRSAVFVVTISEYNRRLLHELYGAEAARKIAVIHCGVDPDVFQPRALSSSGHPFTIVCVASLRNYKGHPYLLDACALLKQRGLAFRCLLVGEGEDRPQIEARIAELGLGEHIELLGHQPRGRVSQLLAGADAVVMPSVRVANGKQEGIPVAAMEALASELPVVATAISGIPELIEDGVSGLLVPERNAMALADALARLHDDPQLGRRLGAAGRATVLREFNLRLNSERLFELLSRDWRSHVGIGAPADPELHGRTGSVHQNGTRG